MVNHTYDMKLHANIYVQSKTVLLSTFAITALVFAHPLLVYAAGTWEAVGPAGFSVSEANFTSLAVDSSNTRYVAFQDFANGNKATVMRFNGTSWETVGAAGFSVDSAFDISLALDSNGLPHVVYRDVGNANGATVMRFNGTSWEVVGAASFSAGFASNMVITFDANDTPYVAYRDGTNSNRVTVMKYNGTSWESVGPAGFTAGSTFHTDIDIDSHGTPYIAYRNLTDGNNITVMKFNGTSWENVGLTGFSGGATYFISFIFDSNDTPYVSFRDGSNGLRATVMTFNGTSWETVGAAGFAAGDSYYTSLAVDSNNTLYIAYQDRSLNKAAAMKFNGTSWEAVGPATGFSAGDATYTSLVIDSNDTLSVAYRDVGNGNKATVMNYVQPDTTPPTVSYVRPADNATNVGVDATFEIAFDEDVATSTGTIVLYKTNDNSAVETIDVTGTKITASSTTAFIIDPHTTLDSETEYYFTIDSGAIEDLANNDFAGITASTTWSFTTADVANPLVATLSPADDATGVALDTNLTVTFNENVATSTGTVIIKKSSDDSTVETIDITSSRVTGSGTTYVINPASDLEYETRYYVQIAGTAFDDIAGNSFAGITASTTWSFTTENTPLCPTVEGAATYNTYPTCGPATCSDRYTLTGSSCAPKSGGGGVIVGFLGTNKQLILPSQEAFLTPRMQTIYPDGTVVYHDELPTMVEDETAPLDTAPQADTTQPAIASFTRTLRLNSEGEDVRALQQLLNAQGFTLAATGAGSPGNETTYFGTRTRNALIRLQEAYPTEILAPWDLTEGTGIFGSTTRGFFNKHYVQ